MAELTYAGAGIPVREDLPAAHGRAWSRLARAGTWWNGRERVAIAAEVRHAERCRLCRRRREAVSPSAVEGSHDGLGELPRTAVEVIHRVVTDPGRLSRSWFEQILARGLDEEQYVELVGVVVTALSIDRFCRGLGVDPHPLPEPLPGEPARRRPAGARLESAWVSMIPASGATGPEADLYGGGRTGNVIRALSLVPDEVRMLQDLSGAHYLPLDRVMDPRAGRTLDRAQIELLAARVSALNECFY